MSPKPNIFARLREMPNVRVRSEPAPEPSPLIGIANPKPEVQQVEPLPIPDRIEFEPVRFRPSVTHEGLGFVELGGERYYGDSIRAALGEAVIQGAFGALNIELPEEKA